MDLTTHRIALLGMVLCSILCIVAVSVLAIRGLECPPVLSTLAGAFAGALALAVQQPRTQRPNGTNGNGKSPEPPDAHG